MMLPVNIMIGVYGKSKYIMNITEENQNPYPFDRKKKKPIYKGFALRQIGLGKNNFEFFKGHAIRDMQVFNQNYSHSLDLNTEGHKLLPATRKQKKEGRELWERIMQEVIEDEI